MVIRVTEQMSPESVGFECCGRHGTEDKTRESSLAHNATVALERPAWVKCVTHSIRGRDAATSFQCLAYPEQSSLL